MVLKLQYFQQVAGKSSSRIFSYFQYYENSINIIQKKYELEINYQNNNE